MPDGATAGGRLGGELGKPGSCLLCSQDDFELLTALILLNAEINVGGRVNLHTHYFEIECSWMQLLLTCFSLWQ